MVGAPGPKRRPSTATPLRRGWSSFPTSTSSITNRSAAAPPSTGINTSTGPPGSGRPATARPPSNSKYATTEPTHRQLRPARVRRTLHRLGWRHRCRPRPLQQRRSRAMCERWSGLSRGRRLHPRRPPGMRVPQCFCPPPSSGPGALGQAINEAAVDVSQWDGVSFWARRGPNGQPLMRVLVGDKFTDDDISYLEYVGDPAQPRLCERRGRVLVPLPGRHLRLVQRGQSRVGQPHNDADVTHAPPVECSAAASNPLGISKDGGGYYCGPPGSHPGAASSGGIVDAEQLPEHLWPDALRQLLRGLPEQRTGSAVGRPRLHALHLPQRDAGRRLLQPAPGPSTPAGTRSPPIRSRPSRTSSAAITSPSRSTSRPSGSSTRCRSRRCSSKGRQSRPYFDLTSVSVVRFTWDTGYVDYYIDDVRFYRLANTSSTTPPP